MQITSESAAGLLTLLWDNAPGEAVGKMPPRAVCTLPLPGPPARRSGASAFAAGHLRLPQLLGLFDLHGVPDPGFQPAVLDYLVFPQH